jgi:hypothetical protein
MTPKQVRVWVANNADALDRMLAAAVALGLGVNGILKAPEGPMGPLWMAVGVGLAWAFISRLLRVPVAFFAGLRPNLFVKGDVVDCYFIDARAFYDQLAKMDGDFVVLPPHVLIVEKLTRTNDGWSVDAVDESGRSVSVPVGVVSLRY